MARILKTFLVCPQTFVATEGTARADQYLGEQWSTNSRPGGRRFVVYGTLDPATGKREKLYDSDCCFDIGNAINTLTTWLAAKLEEKKKQPAAMGR